MGEVIKNEVLSGDIMRFTYTCNNCPQLSLTEEEQEQLKLHGEERFHMCCKYGKRLYHWDAGKNHDRNIYPCSECEIDMKRNGN